MRFEILGPIRAYAGDSEITFTAVRERILLAMLVLHANTPVPVERLIEAIWGDHPPRNVRNQVHGCVSRLRRRLADAAADQVIVTDPAGYQARIDPAGIDLWRFRQATSEARAAAANGHRKQATDRYRAGLGMWRGTALAGIDSDLLRRAAAALDEERLQALEECLTLELSLGAAAELVPQLTDLVRTHPYRERLHGALMHALYRAGRHADALAAYRHLHQVLHDQLGTEPGPDLQRLHRSILTRDPALDPPREVPPRRGPVPRQLPAEVSAFTGRERELARVRGVLTAPREGSRRPAVVVLYGPGGVGKSALAVRAAHDLAGAFPDGHLYADLFGSTPGIRPQSAAEVLGRFLHSLGVPLGEIPSGEIEATALFRTVTADRRLLVVLDNSADREQIALLVPSSPHCAVLVTSRQPLPTLDVDDRLRVDRLPDRDALDLLTGLAGRREVTSEAVRAIVTYCDGLPLAVRIAGGRLASRPDLSGEQYAAALADRSRRLDELQVDDLAVRASIRSGYDALTSGGREVEHLAARAFRALGLLHVPDVAPGVVAAMLAEAKPETAQAALDRLVDAQLLEPARSGRYRLHDLVRLVAAERAAEEDLPADRDEVFSRAIAFYTGALLNADRRFRPARVLPFGEPLVADDVALPYFDTPAQARAWIDDELPSLIASLEQTTAWSGADSRLTLWLSYLLWTSLDARCDWHAAARISRLVLEAATRRRDQELAACGHLLQGRSDACLARYGSAERHHEEALRIMRELGNQRAVVTALNGLGLTHGLRGDHATGLSYYAEALDLARRLVLPDLTAAVSGRAVEAETANTRAGEAYARLTDSHRDPLIELLLA